MRSILMPSGAILSLALVAGCADISPSHITEPATRFASGSGATLIECPTDLTRSTSGTVDILGGTVSLEGHSITVPAGAVLLPTKISLTVPASNYMEIDIKANGLEHFQFEKPVSVTISYSRCTRSSLSKTQLSAWYIDSSTKALLEHMGGVDDKAARTVTFGTGHLSGYSIAE